MSRRARLEDAAEALRRVRLAPRAAARVALALALGSGGVGAALALLLPAVRQDGAGLRLAPLPVGLDLPWGPRVVAAWQLQRGDLVSAARSVTGLALLLLSVACVTVTFLVLTERARRREEAAVHAAVGAPRRRLRRQALLEGTLLGVLGGLPAVGLAIAAAELLRLAWPGEPTPLAMAGVALALAPVPIIIMTARARGTPAPASRLGATGGSVGPVGGGLHLAAAQLALSLALLSGAVGLLGGAPAGGRGAGRSGVGSTDTVLLRVGSPAGRAAPAADYARLVDAASAVPGAGDVAVSSPGAVLGFGPEDSVRTECPGCVVGGLYVPVNAGRARIHAVGPGFFASAGWRVVDGRGIEERDGRGAEPVAVVNEAFVSKLILGRPPLGLRVQVGALRGGPAASTGDDASWCRIVGVVADVVAAVPGAPPPGTPAVYLSALQHPPAHADLLVRPRGGSHGPSAQALEAVVRSAGLGGARAARTVRQEVRRRTAPLRWLGALGLSLGALALLLSVLGIRAALRVQVEMRRGEIGLRRALGASRADVRTLFLRESARVAVTGVAGGLVGALALGRALQLAAPGLPLLSSGPFAGLAAVLVLAALLGALPPARVAGALEPVEALRQP